MQFPMKMSGLRAGILVVVCLSALVLPVSSQELAITTEGPEESNSLPANSNSLVPAVASKTTDSPYDEAPSNATIDSDTLNNSIEGSAETPSPWEDETTTDFPTTTDATDADNLPEFDVVGGTQMRVVPGELCRRTCIRGENRICKFTFTLEHYQSMGIACGACEFGSLRDCEKPQCVLGDGYSKGVMSISRKIPGPDIQVCKDDLVVVDVENQAMGTAAAIHWHGIHMRNTPWMDGVPFVTQCPIPYATTFRYQFYATEPGTQFYHSHSGHHKINGQYGAMIIRQPVRDDPHSNSYDFDLPEHHLVISDWMHVYGEEYFPGLPRLNGIYPDALLINGRGGYLNRATGRWSHVPPIVYYVTPGKRYRFRLINSISHVCPAQLQIEKHTLFVIASDSYEVEPRPFDTLVTNSGERYDFILNANLTPADYWVRLRGMGICGANNPSEAYAILRYRTNDVTSLPPLNSMPSYTNTFPPGVVLNHPNATCFGGINDHCVTELRSLTIDSELLFRPPHHRFYLAFNNYPVGPEELFGQGRYPHFSNIGGNTAIIGAINNLSLVFPHYPPLTQPEDIDDRMFCDEEYWPETCHGQRFCPCIHMLRVKLGSIVELVVVDESQAIGRIHHPFHLHGYKFAVLGLSQHPEGIPMTVPMAKAMEARQALRRNYLNASPPLKDTVSIPSRGYAILRFRADNPGFWLMHCHYEWHLAIGMGLVLQVGNVADMVPPPKDFPKCGNYQPAFLTKDPPEGCRKKRKGKENKTLLD